METDNKPTSDVIATEAQKQPPEVPQVVTMGAALALCAVTSVVTLMITFFAPSIAAKYDLKMGADTSNKVVFLDFDRVMAAGVKRAVEGDRLGVSDLKKDADEFQANITAAIQKYADSGYIVINHKALINASKTQDITPAVIKRLGLTP